MNAIEKINLLRVEMKKHHIDACIIANSDPHLSEYIADYWKEREWLSGFTGSNGVILLTQTHCSLWTDSRYELQAQIELKEIEHQLFITRNIIPDLAVWLNKELPANKQKIAINVEVFSVKAVNILKEKLTGNFELVYADLISPLWKNRPALPADKIFLLDEKYSGKSTAEKIAEVQPVLEESQSDALILTALDDIAWTFNFRCCDIPYNPVAMAYGVIEKNKSLLFISAEKLTSEIKNKLEKQGVTIRGYNDIQSYVSTIQPNKKVLFDSATMNRALFELFPKDVLLTDRPSLVTYLKSKKNNTEIAGFKNACIKDGVALVRFFYWLEVSLNPSARRDLPDGRSQAQAVPSPVERAEREVPLTEMSVSEKLRECRAEQALFFGESFGTIAAYAEHGAIGHYHADSTSNARLEQNNFFLLDSGGQYFDGTTDITRTIALGEPTEQQKTDYTLVLKGYIALDNIRFPKGTCGFQLDVLARQFLWGNGINYGHGTGHGVGHFLNVHEGPQSIRVDNNNTALEEGMILTIEPGIYRAGKYGIRLENMALVTADKKTEFGEFLRFETLTLFPFDKKSIDFSLLNNVEIDWLNDYHKMVFEKLNPYLNEEEQKWLKQKTT